MISPKPTLPVHVRDSVSFLHQNLNDPRGTPKPRYAVVIRSATLPETTTHQSIAEPPAIPSATKVLIIFATKQDHPGFDRETVPYPSSRATSLGLSESSYFYARNIRLIEISKLRKVGHCPPALFLRLAQLANEGLIQLVANGPKQP